MSDKKTGDRMDMAVIKRIGSYLISQKVSMTLMLFSVALGTLCGVIAPALQSKAVDIIAGTREGSLFQTLGIMGAVYILYCIFRLLQGILSAGISQKLMEQLRDELFSRIIDLPVGYLDRHRHGDVMSTMTNDTENISNTLSQSLPSLISGVFTLVGTVAVMFSYCWQLTLLSCSTVLLTVWLTRTMSGRIRRHSREHLKLLGEVNSIIEEKITGFYTVSAYNRQEIVTSQFRDTSDEMTAASVKANISAGAVGPMLNAISNIGFVFIAAFGGYFAINGLITVGIISAFIVYARQFSRPINEIANIYGQLQTALASAERVFALLDQSVEDMDGETLVIDGKADVEFRNVTFSYDGTTDVLRDFDLFVPSGRKVALVGHTGSGKTTVVNLLMRFYEPQKGSILINGREISGMSRTSVRHNTSIVLQDAMLFADTVRNNLLYSNPDASMEDVKRAAAMSHCDELIDSMADGYDTVLSSAGAGISQGQKQLMTIARAFIADPAILILDEATSSVDTRTEKAVQDAMQSVMKGRTSIVIAHRLSTIRDADIIIVMDHGRIVEQGNHRELMDRKGKYYELYMSQYRGFAT